MPSGSHEESASYRGHRIHVVALRYGGQHDGWWVLRAAIWLHRAQLPHRYPDTDMHFACATDACRIGIAWGREVIDNLIADRRDAEETSPQ